MILDQIKENLFSYHLAVLWIDLKTHSWGCKRIEMNITDNNNIVKKLEKDDRLDFDAILEKGKHLFVKSKIVCIIYTWKIAHQHVL